MAEGIYVRNLSALLAYKFVYYLMHVSVMDKLSWVFEAILHILCKFFSVTVFEDLDIVCIELDYEPVEEE